LVGALLITQNVTASGFARGIDVMTFNQYLGADLGPVLEAAAADPFDDAAAAAFNNALVAALEQIAANRTAERIEAQARLIARRRAHIVGLQEVYEFGCIDADPTDDDACAVPRIAGAFADHLDKTRDALNGSYEDVATVVNFNLPPDDAQLTGILSERSSAATTNCSERHPDR
jgi:hypothetical protein